jgi:hypothetical protein
MELIPVIPPNPLDVLRAVDVYVSVAYGSDPMPLTVQSQLAVLRSWKGPFFRSPVIASDGGTPPKRYSIRLGNRNYPHMKLAIERSPDGQGYLFRPDTHDGHCCPPAGHPEHAAFREMMEKNQELASKIEAALAEQGLPTFKTYLQKDLERRHAERQQSTTATVVHPVSQPTSASGVASA